MNHTRKEPPLPDPAPAMTDAQLAAATVGERKSLNGPVHLAPYDPAWPSRFTGEAARIRDALGNRVQLLEHAGSTAVPGLWAKPIIDMVLAVADSADEAAYVPLLEACGYVLRIREPDWFEHRMLKPSVIDGNLHVFSAGCEEIARTPLFRDWLRSHPADRMLYENTKRALAARTWKFTQNYADAKSDVVREILARALAKADS